jgi:His/Glu/Gln/Arg/opine family amino acid ABC transporter permease subunit
MSNNYSSDELFYVAPPEPPPSRRPPPGTVGFIGWIRNNLFSSVFNTILTIVTFTLVSLFLWETIRWAVADAQWSVVINNIQLLNVGQYPNEELWRVELIAIYFLILSAMGVALWGSLTRAAMLTLAISIVLLVIIPIAASAVEPAPIRFMIGDDVNTTPMRFTADEGDTVTLTVEPINDEDTATDEDFTGLMESAQGQVNTRIKWSEIRRQIEEDEIDLSDYNLPVLLQLFDDEGNVLAEVLSTPNQPVVNLEHQVEEDGWFIVRATVVNDQVNLQATDAIGLPRVPEGHAFIRIDNVAIYRTKPADLERLRETYGEIPEVECYTNDTLGCQTAERTLRFVGERSPGKYLRLQISPYFSSVANSVIIAIIVFVAAFGITLVAKRRGDLSVEKWLTRINLIGWLLIIPITWIFLSGFSGEDPILGLDRVPTELWQGLLLTLLLTFISVVASLPLGILFALGRRSGLPVIGTFSVLFIELIRGAPLITILFFAKNIVPFFFGTGANLDDVLRMLIGLTLFSAAYQAEIVRGGLQIIPRGQTEASQALGLNPYQTNYFIVLPQALRAVIPATMSQFVSLFKDTSLVSIIGLFELLGIVELIVNGQQQYRPFVREAYVYVGIIYFVIAFVMSAVSRRLEETGSGAARRR